MYWNSCGTVILPSEAHNSYQHICSQRYFLGNIPKTTALGSIFLTKLQSITFLTLQVALVYGQMNEPPGARARVALTGLTVAEYFRDEEGQDVLLFIDNIFRFTQAGSEVTPATLFTKVFKWLRC